MFPGVRGGMEDVVVAFRGGVRLLLVLKEGQGGSAGGGSGGQGDAPVIVGELDAMKRNETRLSNEIEAQPHEDRVHIYK